MSKLSLMTKHKSALQELAAIMNIKHNDELIEMCKQIARGHLRFIMMYKNKLIDVMQWEEWVYNELAFKAATQRDATPLFETLNGMLMQKYPDTMHNHETPQYKMQFRYIAWFQSMYLCLRSLLMHRVIKTRSHAENIDAPRDYHNDISFVSPKKLEITGDVIDLLCRCAREYFTLYYPQFMQLVQRFHAELIDAVMSSRGA